MMNRPRCGEVKLYDSTKERNRYEEVADLFAIIRTTEALEAAFSRDAVTPKQYSEACVRLISQFKSTEAALAASKAIVSGSDFFREYEIDCPRAYERLINSGAPATTVHPTHDDRVDAVIIAQTTQSFITAMDAVKLDQRAVDQLQPLVADLVGSLNRIHGVPSNFASITKMSLWLQKFNQMRAAEELPDAESRQLLHDLDSSYGIFMQHLESPRK